MRNVFTLFLLVLTALFFTGCAGGQKQTVNLTTGLDENGDKVAVELDRWGAYSIGKTQEEMTKRSDNDARIAEAEARRAEAENKTVQTIINIDTAEEMDAYGQAKMAEAMGNGMEAMGDALVKLAENCGDGKKKEPGIQMPKGVVAETIDSTGNAIVKVADTPTALVGTSLAAAVKIAKNAGDKITGDNNKVERTTASAGKDANIMSRTADTSSEKTDNDNVQLGYNTDSDNESGDTEE